ncbi:MAG: hypothetical protein RLZ19_844 [Actinomycetota bacterium]|jgi:CHASE3 domain sensor protein
MSQGALFAFGAVIFFVVLSGAFLFTIQNIREWVDKNS